MLLIGYVNYLLAHLFARNGPVESGALHCIHHNRQLHATMRVTSLPLSTSLFHHSGGHGDPSNNHQWLRHQHRDYIHRRLGDGVDIAKTTDFVDRLLMEEHQHDKLADDELAEFVGNMLVTFQIKSRVATPLLSPISSPSLSSTPLSQQQKNSSGIPPALAGVRSLSNGGIATIENTVTMALFAGGPLMDQLTLAIVAAALPSATGVAAVTATSGATVDDMTLTRVASIQLNGTIRQIARGPAHAAFATTDRAHMLACFDGIYEPLIVSRTDYRMFIHRIVVTSSPSSTPLLSYSFEPIDCLDFTDRICHIAVNSALPGQFAIIDTSATIRLWQLETVGAKSSSLSSQATINSSPSSQRPNTRRRRIVMLPPHSYMNVKGKAIIPANREMYPPPPLLLMMM
jgi:hypothetical protein